MLEMGFIANWERKQIIDRIMHGQERLIVEKFWLRVGQVVLNPSELVH